MQLKIILQYNISLEKGKSDRAVKILMKLGNRTSIEASIEEHS